MTILFEPGQVVFLIRNDYPDGGCPVIIVEKDRRDNHFIIRRRLSIQSSWKQVVSNEIIRKLTYEEVEKNQDDIEFLISKYNEFDRMK